MLKISNILIAGSQNVKEQDRFLKRSEIQPVQILNNSEFEAITYFNEIGQYGISSMAWDSDNPLILYYSTGKDFVKCNLKEKYAEKINIEGLGGVHEMDYINGQIFIANTRFDEIVVYDPKLDLVSKRIKLEELETRTIISRSEAEEGDVVDKYHCNQIFKGFDEHIYFLAHHVTGRQLLQKIAGAFLKSQGSGGVFDLDNSMPYNLSLKAPHSVTKVLNREYWVFNSAYSTIQIHDKDWKQIDEVEMSGFGRGACLNSDQSILFAGVSPPRQRYMERFKAKKKVFSPKVDLFSTKQRKHLKTFDVSNIEQVNNLYLMSDEQVHFLLKL